MSEYSDDNIEPLQIDSTCKSEDTAISSPPTELENPVPCVALV